MEFESCGERSGDYEGHTAAYLAHPRLSFARLCQSFVCDVACRASPHHAVGRDVYFVGRLQSCASALVDALRVACSSWLVARSTSLVPALFALKHAFCGKYVFSVASMLQHATVGCTHMHAHDHTDTHLNCILRGVAYNAERSSAIMNGGPDVGFRELDGEQARHDSHLYAHILTPKPGLCAVGTAHACAQAGLGSISQHVCLCGESPKNTLWLSWQTRARFSYMMGQVGEAACTVELCSTLCKQHERTPPCLYTSAGCMRWQRMTTIFGCAHVLDHLLVHNCVTIGRHALPRLQGQQAWCSRTATASTQLMSKHAALRQLQAVTVLL